MGLALACDIRIGSEKAIFSEAFVNMGLIPGDGSCWQLPKMISLSDTYLLQYTGDKIDGAEALRIGLISKLYSHETVLHESLKLAEKIGAGPTLSHSLTKYLVQTSMDLSLEESMKLFEEGIGLTDACKSRLEDAEQKIQLLLKNSDGKLNLEETD